MSTHPYQVAVLTLSDAATQGTRADKSGPAVGERMQKEGYFVKEYLLLPDEQALITHTLKRLCDEGGVQLVLTTGGTGLSPRDCTPEATLSVAHRLVPGMAEAMRAHSMSITPNGMLSRSVCATRGRTLIVNLPGSPKAACECLEAILPCLPHALSVLCGTAHDCANTGRAIFD